MAHAFLRSSSVPAGALFVGLAIVLATGCSGSSGGKRRGNGGSPGTDGKRSSWHCGKRRRRLWRCATAPLVPSSSGGHADSFGGSNTSGGSAGLGDAGADATSSGGSSGSGWLDLLAPAVGAATPSSFPMKPKVELREGAQVSSHSGSPADDEVLESTARGLWLHAYVDLGATGQSVTWTNDTGKNITAINVRYSISGRFGRRRHYFHARPTRRAGSFSPGAQCQLETKPGSTREALLRWHGQYSILRRPPCFLGRDTRGYRRRGDSAGKHDYATERCLEFGGVFTTSTWSIWSVPFRRRRRRPANSLSIVSDCGAGGKQLWVRQHERNPELHQPGAVSRNRPCGFLKVLFTWNTTKGLSMNGITIQGAGMWCSVVHIDQPCRCPRRLPAMFSRQHPAR